MGWGKRIVVFRLRGFRLYKPFLLPFSFLSCPPSLMTAMTCFSSGLEHPSSFEHTLPSFEEFEARLRASSPTSISSCAPKLPSRRAGRNQPQGRRASIIGPSLWLNFRPVANPTRRQIRRVQGFAFFFFRPALRLVRPAGPSPWSKFDVGPSNNRERQR